MALFKNQSCFVLSFCSIVLSFYFVHHTSCFSTSALLCSCLGDYDCDFFCDHVQTPVLSKSPFLYVCWESVVWGPQRVLKGVSLGPQQNAGPITSPLIPAMSHMTTECITILVNTGVNDPQLNPDICPFWH